MKRDLFPQKIHNCQIVTYFDDYFMTADYNSKLKSNLRSHQQPSLGLRWRQSRLIILIIQDWQTGPASLFVYRYVAVQIC